MGEAKHTHTHKFWQMAKKSTTENKQLEWIRQKEKKGKQSRLPTRENIKINQMLYGILLH